MFSVFIAFKIWGLLFQGFRCSFYNTLKFTFYQDFVCVVLLISVVSLAVSVNSILIGHLSTSLETKIFEITCAIIISAKRLLEFLLFTNFENSLSELFFGDYR